MLAKPCVARHHQRVAAFETIGDYTGYKVDKTAVDLDDTDPHGIYVAPTATPEVTAVEAQTSAWRTSVGRGFVGLLFAAALIEIVVLLGLTLR